MKRTLEAIRFSGSGLYFVGAAALAVLAGFAVYGYLSAAVPSQPVVTVVRDLSPGATVQAGDVSLKRLPSGAVPQGAITSVDDVVGSRVRYGLASGDLIRKQHLVPQNASALGQKLAQYGAEFRAVMLPGELVPAVDQLMPGDRLELTGVLPGGEGSGGTVAVPLAVASVLDIYQDPADADRTTVLVAVKDSEVSKVALTMRVGTLMVAFQGREEAVPAPPMGLHALISGMQ